MHKRVGPGFTSAQRMLTFSLPAKEPPTMSEARTAPCDDLPLVEVLMNVKTRARSVRPQDVSRAPLIESCRSSRAPIVVVTAPAGYGKSTLLAEWAATEDRQVLWVSLDRFDDDPVSLIRAIAAACAPLDPRIERIIAGLHGVGTTALGRSAPMLSAVLAQVVPPFVLFIDDIHTVDSPSCQDVLEVVLQGVPAGSQVVMAGRQEHMYLAKLRASGRTCEIGTDELRLDNVSARKIFEAANVTASHDQIALIVERCEGWPTGLFLCSIAASRGIETVAPSGTDRLLSDYLFQECVAALPKKLREFLVFTSVLEQLSAPLCDAILGETNSRLQLRKLEALNLFLIPLDPHRGWHRYHTLFREFLLAELEAEGAGVIADLHRAAADWFITQHAKEAAVEHLIAAGETARVIELVSDIALPMYQDGKIATVERWLQQLGDAVIETSGTLTIFSGWVSVLQGKSPDAEHWAGVLDRFEPTGTREEVVAFQAARAMVQAAMCMDGAERVMRDAVFAADHVPELSPWRDQAMHLLGSAMLLAGRVDAAREAFADASLVAQEWGNHDSVILSEAELAILALDDGEIQAAAQHARVAVHKIEEGHLEGYPTTALALAVRARVALRLGEVPQTRNFLARAMRTRIHCTHVLPFIAMRLRLQLVKVFVGMGDRAAAAHIMREIDDLLSQRPNVGTLVSEIEEMRMGLSSLDGSRGNIPLTPAELRLMPYLQTHLTTAEIGSRLYVSRNTVSTQVGSIYRKLGVSTRAAAVERATEIGLLGA